MWHRSLKDHIYFWVRNIKMIFMLKITKILFTLLHFCILEMKHDFEEHLDFYELGWRFAFGAFHHPPHPWTRVGPLFPSHAGRLPRNNLGSTGK